MKRVLVVGAGRVGRTLFHMLSAEDGYDVRICDARPELAQYVADHGHGQAFPEPTTDEASFGAAMDGMDAVISAAPFAVNPMVAEAAATANVHYLDLTEDVSVTRFVKKLAESGRGRAFVPQCGVAPGFITLAGVFMIELFDEVDAVTLRVGALPDQPNNRLKYNLTWSTDGLVNEYLHPCESLRRGKVTMVPALEGKEEVVIDGVAYEAFTTSGGVGTLCHTYEGKIRRLDYKTIRYPGHLELIRFLMDDLGFREHPEELVQIFNRSIPTTRDDFVIVSVRVLGTRNGRFEEQTFWRKVEGQQIRNTFFTGIEISTAAGACGVLHLLLDGHLPQQGFVRMEDVKYRDFMDTPFGKYYARRDRA